MRETKIQYPEDGEWTEEDIEDFMEWTEDEIETGGNGGDDDDDQAPVHPGAVMAGIVLFFIIMYSIYIGEFRFAGLNSVLLTLLALGSKAIN